MIRVAELDGYELHAHKYGYWIEEPESNYKHTGSRILDITPSNVVEVDTDTAKSHSPAAVAEYAHTLLAAVKVANYFQAVIDDRENN